MLLTLTTTYAPATDLGYLLYKHPQKCQSFALSFGTAHVFYPEAGQERCTAALLLDVDPVGLVRGKSSQHSLRHYVNDRPYTASSLLSVAIAQVFGTALGGRSKDRPQLAETPIPLIASLPVLPCRGGEAFLRALFEPLGYEVTAQSLPLDETFPEWSASSYLSVRLEQTVRLAELLSHLYVLIPVLDEDKHYWVGDDEVDKLLRHGEGWLRDHPARETIARRYLKRQGRLTRMALAQLVEAEENAVANAATSAAETFFQALPEDWDERPYSLNQQRLEAVRQALKQAGAKRLVDLGCGEGKLLKVLLNDPDFEQITGVDVAYRSLEIAQQQLQLDQLSPAKRQRITVMQGALTYRDRRLEGYDAATLIEVIEHLDPDRLAALEQVVFSYARPQTVIVTTPNAEYNERFPTLPAGTLRHPDHRFEWTRQEFQGWANRVADAAGYRVAFFPIGQADPRLGSPTQMGVFSR